jgi:hypothetical protein
MNYLDTLDGFIRRFRTANFTITNDAEEEVYLRAYFGEAAGERPEIPSNVQVIRFQPSIRAGASRALCGPFRATLHHGDQPDRIRTRKWLEQRRIDDRETVVFARCLG